MSLFRATVHPHGRGDNLTGRYNRGRTYGSPPRAWGQCLSHLVVTGSPGGSPPRAWGQCARARSLRSARRFTPTGVGTMRCERFRTSRKAVHPHGRWDNARSVKVCIPPLGSPPRAWGQFIDDVIARANARFTPTGVGTMGSATVWYSPVTVHPHGRGDNDGWTASWSPYDGSPPRAWGQCGTHLQAVRRSRFTPTGVGTISLDALAAAYESVHPHGRGDNLTHDNVRYRGYGSPPRAWGQSAHAAALAIPRRFTPTGVGTITAIAAQASR